MSTRPANPRAPAQLPLPTPDEITFLTPDPFVPKPLVADILRTRYCIPGSIFLVEGVDVFRAATAAAGFGSGPGSASQSSSKPNRKKNHGRWRGVRLLLGDGELCVQALLAGDMHSYVDRGDVAVGAYVTLESFSLERAGGVKNGDGDGGKGKMVMMDHYQEGSSATGTAYLAVTNLITVGWNNRLLALLDAERTRTVGPDTEPEHVLPAEENVCVNEVKVETAHVIEPEIKQTEDLTHPRPQPDVDSFVQGGVDAAKEDQEEDNFFEVMDISQDKLAQRRAEVTMATNASSSSSPSLLSDYLVPPADPDQLPWSSTDPRKPLKLTTLRAIPNLPYKQNWSINVLAVVASLSDVQASTLPPFGQSSQSQSSQRVARLAHPSTPKQVHLTVFLDAPDFAPAVGSVVLLLGVKNHRFDGGSLKKYASDRSKHGGTRWWFDDPAEFAWCDVQGLHAWWRRQKQLEENGSVDAVTK
jgi:hypothetical protein